MRSGALDLWMAEIGSGDKCDSILRRLICDVARGSRHADSYDLSVQIDLIGASSLMIGSQS